MNLGDSVTVSVVEGVIQTLVVNVPSQQTLVMEVVGTETQAGLYNAANVGRLRVCGTNSRGRYSMKNNNDQPGNFGIFLVPKATGSVTITLRAWSFVDYWWANPIWTSYKNTC